MSYNRRNEDMFRYFISGLDKKMQAELSLMFARNSIGDVYITRKLMYVATRF